MTARLPYSRNESKSSERVYRLNPPYVHYNPRKTQVVKLRKIDGKIYQDCDVYIGPKVNNTSWSLEESEWMNPFSFFGDKPSLANRAYREHIEHNDLLLSKLPNLRGKRLGCFCNNTRLCHGQVLVDMVAKCHQPESVHEDEKYAFFKGDMSCLSNLYHTVLTEDWASFFNAEHFRLWIIAKRFNKTHFLELLEETSVNSSSSICQISKALTKSLMSTSNDARYSTEHQIEDMLRAVNKKYLQCPEFRITARDLVKKRKVILEATVNKFWGCGRDIKDIISMSKDQTVFSSDFPGQNMLGFIIMYAAAKNQLVFSAFEEANKSSHSLVTSTEEQQKKLRGGNVTPHTTQHDDHHAQGIKLLKEQYQSLTITEREAPVAVGLSNLIDALEKLNR